MHEATEPDEQQKLIATLQKTVQRKDGEITRLRGNVSDLNNKCNALIRQVKSLQRKAA
jgi:peptidoglycan hydrolase CwlO-like protein